MVILLTVQEDIFLQFQRDPVLLPYALFKPERRKHLGLTDKFRPLCLFQKILHRFPWKSFIQYLPEQPKFQDIPNLQYPCQVQLDQSSRAIYIFFLIRQYMYKTILCRSSTGQMQRPPARRILRATVFHTQILPDGTGKITLKNLILNRNLTVKYNPDPRHPHVYISLFQPVIRLLIVHIPHQPVDLSQLLLVYKYLNLTERRHLRQRVQFPHTRIRQQQRVNPMPLQLPEDHFFRLLVRFIQKKLPLILLIKLFPARF